MTTNEAELRSLMRASLKGDAAAQNDLTRLLSQLPDKMRRAIQSVKLEGLTVAEAANRCDMSESAVKVNVYRGLKALAATIAREKRI